MGMNLAAPDVCRTPAPPIPSPIPIPYPNTSMVCTGVPAAYTIFISGGPAHNMETSPPVSLGDNAGVAGGMVSQVDMGPTRQLLGSFTVLYDGMPATKLTSMTGQNGTPPNTVGMTTVPSQVTVLILA
jgi:hypothetical protein